MRRPGKTKRLRQRRLPRFVVASAIFFLILVFRIAWAEEAFTPPKPEVTPPADWAAQASATDVPDKRPSDEASPPKGQTFDPAVVGAGQAAFNQSCTTCHAAARSLERTKDLAGWRGTVRRMAAKRDADVATGDIEAIAVFLASRSASASGTQASTGGAAADSSSISTFATLSPMWRSGNDRLQNPDFGPLAFFGASWQSNVVSARVTLCITCHGVKEGGQISRVEPVEAAVHWDLSQYLEGHWRTASRPVLTRGGLWFPSGPFPRKSTPVFITPFRPP